MLPSCTSWAEDDRRSENHGPTTCATLILHRVFSTAITRATEPSRQRHHRGMRTNASTFSAFGRDAGSHPSRRLLRQHPLLHPGIQGSARQTDDLSSIHENNPQPLCLLVGRGPGWEGYQEGIRRPTLWPQEKNSERAIPERRNQKPVRKDHRHADLRSSQRTPEFVTTHRLNLRACAGSHTRQ